MSGPEVSGGALSVGYLAIDAEAVAFRRRRSRSSRPKTSMPPPSLDCARTASISAMWPRGLWLGDPGLRAAPRKPSAPRRS